MRVDSDRIHPQVLPSTVPPLPSRPDAALIRAPKDRVEPRQSETANGADGVSTLRNWFSDEWSTVAGAAHGLASVPGVVSKAWQDAAKTNDGFAKTIDATVGHWQQQTAAQRQLAIDGLSKAAAPVSTTASNVARELTQANRFPLALEKTLDTAVAKLPAQAQPTMQRVVRSFGGAISELPAPVAARAEAGAHALEAAASTQTAKASTTIGTVSEFVGRTVGKAHGLITGSSEASAMLDKFPLLRDTPVAGAMLTGAAIAGDIRGGKSVADAVVANVGGTLVGTAAGDAVTAGLSAWIESASIADEAAEALGAAAAAGPVGWTVAAGVVAATAVGYGVYKAAESKAGQDIIDGVTQLSSAKIERGIGEAGSAIAGVAASAGRLLSNHAPAPAL